MHIEASSCTRRPRRARRAMARVGWLSAVLALAGCSPTFNWRELRPGDGALRLMFPCKPASHARSVTLAGAPVRLELHACRAGEVTWAVALADVADPAQVPAALAALRDGAVANLAAGAPEREEPLVLPGATPQPGTLRLALQGRLPDGVAVREELAVFAHGTRVYQVTSVGTELPPEQVETFFGSLRLGE